MHLGRQRRVPAPLDAAGEAGYAMAALLVALSIMAVMMTVAMPVWHQTAQREKETELVFRGQQYARAIGLFERKYANTPPPDLDVLVREHFLRKKYKDPITNKDFVVIPAGAAQATTPGVIPGDSATATFQRNNATNTTPQTGTAPQAGTAPQTGAAGTVTGGIIGVTSSSKETSIRIYNGATRYSDWRFVYTSQAAAPGGATGAATPGAQGNQNGQGRGQNQGGAFGAGGGNRGGGGQRGGQGQGPGQNGPARGQPGQPGQGTAPGGFGAPPAQGQSPFGPARGR